MMKDVPRFYRLRFGRTVELMEFCLSVDRLSRTTPDRENPSVREPECFIVRHGTDELYVNSEALAIARAAGLHIPRSEEIPQGELPEKRHRIV